MQAVLTLPPALESARRARRFLERALRAAGIDGDQAWTVTLVTHELVTNAVLHARTDFDLRLAVDGHTVHVEVRDDNPAGRCSRGRPASPRPGGASSSSPPWPTSGAS